MFNIQDLTSVNRLWRKIYPYAAAQAMSYYGRETGAVLELGSFSGGITFALAASYPGLTFTIADENPAYLRHLRNEIFIHGLSSRINLIDMSLDQPLFRDGSFDLVILRGAFFFIMDRPQILTEIYRIMKPGGLGFVGGGYGKGAPQGIIDEIAEESRILNDRLGRRRVTIEELKDLLSDAGLSNRASLIEEGGIWILLRK
jgi:ubiquinone/menaquinone biosynthesis C-methylase UbiE